MKRFLSILRAKMEGRYRPFEPSKEMERYPVPILSHWLQSLELESVRMIPVAVLDVSRRPDLSAYVNLHSGSGAGDVHSQWAVDAHDTGRTLLVLTIQKPAHLVMVLEFELESDLWLVDAIVATKALVMKAGKPNLSRKEAFGMPGVLLTVSASWYGNDWHDRLTSFLMGRHVRTGRSAAEAQRLALEEMDSHRQIYVL
jgi:hypothetical protein